MKNLQSTELRINNIVYDNLGGILKIKGISIDSNLSHLRPIPLTEEWLLKFGFEEIQKTRNGITVYGFKNKNMLLTLTDNGYEFFHGYGLGGRFTKVENVYQLQNLYYSLTGKELTL
jgi:hypothetical protein